MHNGDTIYSHDGPKMQKRTEIAPTILEKKVSSAEFVSLETLLKNQMVSLLKQLMKLTENEQEQAIKLIKESRDVVESIIRVYISLREKNGAKRKHFEQFTKTCLGNFFLSVFIHFFVSPDKIRQNSNSAWVLKDYIANEFPNLASTIQPYQSALTKTVDDFPTF